MRVVATLVIALALVLSFWTGAEGGGKDKEVTIKGKITCAKCELMVEGQKGWISNFHRALEIRLAQLMGRPPSLWRDPKLSGNDVFSDRLVQRLPKVALLVCVLSPRYVRSDWCMRELSEFVKATAATGGLRIGDKARVFKVVKTPVPLGQQMLVSRTDFGDDTRAQIDGGTRAVELSMDLGWEDVLLFAPFDGPSISLEPHTGAPGAACLPDDDPDGLRGLAPGQTLQVRATIRAGSHTA